MTIEEYGINYSERSLTLGDLITEQSTVAVDQRDLIISGVTADSRAVRPGYLFAALRGSAVHGFSFVDKAIDAGAVAILMSAEDARTMRVDLPAGIVPVEALVPRRELAKMAARFYAAQPAVIAAITGTAGKTSVASFLRQIWQKAGFKAASIGTVGVVCEHERIHGSLTTPDPVKLHETIDQLARSHISHLAIEASSHGLDQHRLDGVRMTLGGFTNLGRDHLDYHASLETYFEAKMGLVDRLLPAEAPFICEPESAYGSRAARRAARRGLLLSTVGKNGSMIDLKALEETESGQKLVLVIDGHCYEVLLPLIGRFQASNALVAGGMALASGVAPDTLCTALSQLRGEVGRLEHVGKTKTGAPVFIDYAHKVEALECVLQTLRPYVKRKLICVFGCGGDRDQGKRALMGTVANQLADQTIITDDNPRYEDAAEIRAMILARLPQGIEIAERKEAISTALCDAQTGDVVVICGKGHETGQIVKGQILPFSDHEVVAKALQ